MENSYLNKNALAGRVYNLIPIGKKSSISMNSLASLTNVDNRIIRQIVQDLRMNGLVVCSCTHGYFRPDENAHDVYQFYKYYHQRANTNLKSLKATETYLRSKGIMPDSNSEGGQDVIL